MKQMQNHSRGLYIKYDLTPTYIKEQLNWGKLSSSTPLFQSRQAKYSSSQKLG
jgi:hypothetical protein